MGTTLTRRWELDFNTPRKHRRAGTYHPYLPHPIHEWEPQLDEQTLQTLHTAEQTLKQTAETLGPHSGTSVYTLAEATHSSHIEDVTPTIRQISRTAASHDTGKNPKPRTDTAETLGLVLAHQQIRHMLRHPTNTDLKTLNQAHQTLMTHSNTPHIGGKIRDTQNWIGGNNWHPLQAEYIPPPPEHCHPLIQDLLNYTKTRHHNPLLQAATTHAQYENIHPYPDGNGRTGRAILHSILQTRVGKNNTIPPISAGLSIHQNTYFNTLRTYQQYTGPPNHPKRTHQLLPWLQLLTDTINQTSQAVTQHHHTTKQLLNLWTRQLRTNDPVTINTLRPFATHLTLTLKTLTHITGYDTRTCQQQLQKYLNHRIIHRRQPKNQVELYESDRAHGLYNILIAGLTDPQIETSRHYRLALQPKPPQTIKVNWEKCGHHTPGSPTKCGLPQKHPGRCHTLQHSPQPHQ